MQTYDLYTRLFRSTIAAAVYLEYISAWLVPKGTQMPSGLVSFHMSWGVIILILILAHMVQLYFSKAPQFLSTGDSQERIARWTRFALYALLISMPLFGWLWASARGWQITVFGFASLPAIANQSAALAHSMGALHIVMGILILLIAGSHILASLYYALIRKDKATSRIWA